jgi:cytochrome c oxidase subunit II
MQQIPASLLTLLAGVAITLISLWVGQHHNLLPEQASEQAPLVDNFFSVMVTIATALFLVVQGAILLFVIQFRRRPGDDTDGVPIEGSVPLEIVWTAIPAVIVIGLGIYSVDIYERMGGFGIGHDHGAMAHSSTAHNSMSHDSVAQASEFAPMMASAVAAPLPSGEAMTAATEPLPTEPLPTEPLPTEPLPKVAKYGVGSSLDDTKTADLVVNVTGLQYAWLFNYTQDGTAGSTEGGLSTGELHVPVGKAVQLNISAQDVIHSFWVPQFRLKQDAIPGQPTELRFVATKIGTFPIVCTELCGSYHGSMRTQLVVHSPEEYDAWVTENRVAQAPALDAKDSTAIATAPRPDSAIPAPAVDLDSLSNADFLAPYAQEMGVTTEAIAQLSAHSS